MPEIRTGTPASEQISCDELTTVIFGILLIIKVTSAIASKVHGEFLLAINVNFTEPLLMSFAPGV